MTITAFLVSMGIGTCAFVEEPAGTARVPIAGTVVDAGRRPAAGAGVYFSFHEAGTMPGEVVDQAETDARGQFRLEIPGAAGGGPQPGTLWAYRPGALVATRSIARETLPPDWRASMVLDEPARLVLESSVSVSLAGRVVAPSGHRVAGAKVHIRVQERDDAGQVYGDALVVIRGAYVIKTNDTGWYRSPLILDPDLKYRAMVEADGYEPARTPWTAGNARTSPQVVPRTRDVAGPRGPATDPGADSPSSSDSR